MSRRFSIGARAVLGSQHVPICSGPDVDLNAPLASWLLRAEDGSRSVNVLGILCA
jgi:hypothetical protein